MKEITLLEEQIERLKARDFDLEGWKQHTSGLLGRIFGENSLKVKQIQGIEYDYSSWSLRDTSGRSSNIEKCRKLGHEILTAAIEEIRALGLPQKNSVDKTGINPDVIVRALENELKVSEIRDLIATIDSDLSPDEKKQALLSKLKKMEVGQASAILSFILAHPDMVGKLRM